MAEDPRVQEVLERALAEVAGARSTSDLEQVRVLDALQAPHAVQEADRAQLARRLRRHVECHHAIVLGVMREQHGRALDRLDPEGR